MRARSPHISLVSMCLYVHSHTMRLVDKILLIIASTFARALKYSDGPWLNVLHAHRQAAAGTHTRSLYSQHTLFRSLFLVLHVARRR